MADVKDVEETVEEEKTIEDIDAQERISSLELDQDWMMDDMQYFHEEIEEIKRAQLVNYAVAVIGFWYFCYKAGGKIGEIAEQL